jgi:hypothetical protein
MLSGVCEVLQQLLSLERHIHGVALRVDRVRKTFDATQHRDVLLSSLPLQPLQLRPDDPTIDLMRLAVAGEEVEVVPHVADRSLDVEGVELDEIVLRMHQVRRAVGRNPRPRRQQRPQRPATAMAVGDDPF